MRWSAKIYCLIKKTKTNEVMKRMRGKPLKSVSHLVVYDSLQPFMDYRPPGSAVHGILQARILE